MNFYKFFQYIKYRATARHWKGYEIQPPFAFDFVRRVLREDSEYYCFESIEDYRMKLIDDNRTILVNDLGAGSKVFKEKHRKVGAIALNCTTPEWKAKTIFRIIQETKPKTLIELGTSLGIGTIYLGCSNRNAKLYTLEGCPSLAAIAQEGIDKFALKNTQIKIGAFNETLPKILDLEEHIDFVYLDGDHTKESTLRYFNLLLPKLNSNSVVIMDDIYWSEEMTQAWKIITKMEEVRVSFDIFHMGILFFRDGCLKQHYKVWI
ncbi:MAG: class I SAM-dependent methyltransferase [Breznakibacter sp.]|nr:class I SAM-dependent methyltransferase [Breznakibacter sp.]